LSLIETNVNFTKILLQELSTRIIQTSSRASFQQLYTLEYGLTKLLKLQTDADLEISKEDMAAYLGISVRSLNRTLKQVQNKIFPILFRNKTLCNAILNYIKIIDLIALLNKPVSGRESLSFMC